MVRRSKLAELERSAREMAKQIRMTAWKNLVAMGYALGGGQQAHGYRNTIIIDPLICQVLV